jgi:hypothetical protein
MLREELEVNIDFEYKERHDVKAYWQEIQRFAENGLW